MQKLDTRKGNLSASVKNIFKFIIKTVMKKVTRTRCEVYSRIVGYIRPISQWNVGKQAEWGDRATFHVA